MSDKLLSMEEIGNATDVEFQVIQMPEWGGAVRIGSITAEDIVEWNESNSDPAAKRLAGIRLVVQSMVDKDGKRIGTPKAVDVLKKRSAASINKLVEKVLVLNKLNAKGLEEVKNGSGEVTSVASPTA
ncbi:MAG: hypothetical protein ACHQX3_05380 [Nitrospirales bacterium]